MALEVYEEVGADARSSGPVVGKGDAMWRSLSVARGDLIVFADADTANFERHFVYGLLGPLLSEPGGAVREGRPTTARSRRPTARSSTTPAG